MKHPLFPLNRVCALLASCFVLQGAVWAQSTEPSLSQVEVQSSRNSVLGEAGTASEGVITQQQLDARTVYRPGEVLEAVPGLIVSQHSGEGKANQFYLRGFNLDHGTDLRTTIDGMLVNQRSHAHGQGWTDVNFLMPELTTLLDYRKGPFYAAEGDFSSAGSVSVKYADKLPQGIASIGLGQNGYARTFLANSPKLGDGNLLYAIELFKNDGPFTVADDYRKRNGVLRYSQGTEANGFNVTLMAYDAKWHSTDQIPLRAVANGSLGRFDAVDQTDGGSSSRYSVSGAWRQSGAAGSTQVNAYVVRSRLDLFSNFTYFMDDPVNGDQFAQPDRRTTTGINASHTWASTLMGRSSENTVGLQFQNDNINNALQSTVARQVLSTTRADQIVERSLGVYLENKTEWLEKFRTVAGVRADTFHFKVDSDNAANSGTASATKVSPKLNLIFGPWNKTEFYTSAGYGFHSNDARGTTITIDPKTGLAADKVPPLVRSKGLEFGVRTEAIAGLQSALSFYRLDFDSELTFAGDAGTTNAGRPSRRARAPARYGWQCRVRSIRQRRPAPRVAATAAATPAASSAALRANVAASARAAQSNKHPAADAATRHPVHHGAPVGRPSLCCSAGAAGSGLLVSGSVLSGSATGALPDAGATADDASNHDSKARSRAVRSPSGSLSK